MRGRITRRARDDDERGRGQPLQDVDRACRHYDIDPDEYYSCPECYPLPERGTGLSRREE